MSVTWPPEGLPERTPAEYAASLADWAGEDESRLHGALLEGNGTTRRAFVRRLSDEQLRKLHGRVTGTDDLQTRAELRRRAAT